jgi:hypothetical protein
MKSFTLVLFFVGVYCCNSYTMNNDEYFINELSRAALLFKESKKRIYSLGEQMMPYRPIDYQNNRIPVEISMPTFLSMVQTIDQVNAFAAQAILLASSVCNNRRADDNIKAYASVLLLEIKTYTDAGLINVRL